MGGSYLDLTRMRLLKPGNVDGGPVIYWMSRDQRVNDNWALLHAQELALKTGAPLAVVFCLVPAFLHATIRQYGFMLKGLEDVEQRLAGKQIPFFLLAGDPRNVLPEFLKSHEAGALITDFDPLRVKNIWKKAVVRRSSLPVHEVDAHNIIPCWIASSKREYGAFTLRPKLQRLLPSFLTAFPAVKRHPFPWQGRVARVRWKKVWKELKADRTVPEVDWLLPGEVAAAAVLNQFIRKKLDRYAGDHNDPARRGQSGLSPYLHFGHVAAQRVALAVMKARAREESKDLFLEELIVRRELSDNFCLYNPDYDNTACFPRWAQESLNKHRKDFREHLYTLREFEGALTHDALWNAAQMEMVKTGRMHGYLRMYWAKKILEWTASPEQAMAIAVFLNDRYELDGRDPNGYTGIAWSIGGVHDRAWGERRVFGKVRFMSERGLRSKFDVDAYIDYCNRL